MTATTPPAAPGPTRHPMSAVDAAWLGMDAPNNLMMITAVLRFAEPMDWDRLRDVVGKRLLERYPRFTRRAVHAVTPMDPAHWSDDSEADLENHVTRVELGSGEDPDAALTTLVGQLLSRPLDLRRSPWELHLIDGYGEGSALVVRLHHCIGDGIALAEVLLELTDSRPDAPVALAAPEASTVDRPRRARLRRAVKSAVFGLDVIRTTARILMLSRDPRTKLSGRLGRRKLAAWTAPQDLQRVKDIARALDATVNDVLLAATAGALRRYLQDNGERAHDLRVFVPVNLRRPEEPIGPDLGNRFGLIFVRLPVAESDPVARVKSVSAAVRRVRGSSEGAATFALLGILGALPSWAHGLAVRILGSKSSAIVTNVPGPKDPVYLAGTAVDSVVFWVPQAASLGLGISIFSYAGQVHVGVAADAGIVPEPDRLARWVEQELDELATRVGVGT